MDQSGTAAAFDALEIEVRELRAALETSRVIAAAQGMLMERYDIDADAAIAALKRVSMELNNPVRDVAAQLILTRQLPRSL